MGVSIPNLKLPTVQIFLAKKVTRANMLQTTSHEIKPVAVLSGKNTWRIRKARPVAGESWELIVDEMKTCSVQTQTDFDTPTSNVNTDISVSTLIPNSMGAECTFPGCTSKLHTGWMFQQFDQSLLFVGTDHDLSSYDVTLFPDSGCANMVGIGSASTSTAVSFAAVASMAPSSPLPFEAADISMPSSPLPFQEEVCEKADDEEVEQSAFDPRYKTKPCKYTNCTNGSNCVFAHSPRELRTQQCYSRTCEKVKCKNGVWINFGPITCCFLHHGESKEAFFKRLKKSY